MCKSAAAVLPSYTHELFISVLVLLSNYLLYSHDFLFHLSSVSSPLYSSHLPSVFCVTSPSRDNRYRAPPPTPPGYQGLSLGDMQAREGGALRPAYLKPPNYSMALQRSKLLGDTWRMAAEHHASFTKPAIVASHAVSHSKEGTFSKSPNIMNDLQQTLC